MCVCCVCVCVCVYVCVCVCMCVCMFGCQCVDGLHSNAYIELMVVHKANAIQWRLEKNWGISSE